MTEEKRFLLMRSGVNLFALSLEQVAEIMEIRPLSPVPRAPVWCHGALRSAGVVVAVIDLAMYTGEESETHPDKLVVIDHRIGSLALKVGTVAVVAVESGKGVEKDDYGRWLVMADARAELLDAGELVQEISAAMGK